MRPLLLILGLSGAALSAQTFPKTCPNGSPLPPFQSVMVAQPIDKTCPVNGYKTSQPPTKLQNTAKNNFCATAPSMDVTPTYLVQLQATTAKQGIPFGSALPTDRKELQALGEGKLVRMKGYLIEAHHADVDTGESVNCDMAGEPSNDIHIALGETDGEQECASVTAEISPHFRPVTWNQIGHFEIWNPTTKMYVPNVAIATRLQSRAYRITGQLFFDASHVPCPCGTTDASCSPVRSSLWEIHPVYSIEVCKLGTNCVITDDTNWTPFDQFWGPVTGNKRHEDRP